MRFYLSWGVIVIFIAFYITYNHNRRVKLRREERKENLKNRNQHLLDYLHKKNNNTSSSGENTTN